MRGKLLLGSACLVGSGTAVWGETGRTNLEVTTVKLKDSSIEVTSSVTWDREGRETQWTSSSFQLKLFTRFSKRTILSDVAALHLVVAPLILA